MALDRFQQLLQGRLQQAQAQQLMQDRAFEQQKYADLIARQKMQDEATMEQLRQQQEAAALIPQAIEAQEAEYLQYGPQPTPMQPNYQDIITQALVQGSGNPYAAPAVLDYVKLLGATSPKESTKAPTDLGSYVNDGVIVYKAQNPDASEAEVAAERKRLGLEFKRAQAPEVAATTGARVGTKEGVEDNFAIYKAAENAQDQIAKIDELLTEVKTGEGFTGFGAELKKNIERVRAALGSEVAAGRVSDTEYLNALMGSEVFPMIKALGVGARGLDTPAEREFMREVLTGGIQLNKDTIIKMAELRKSVAERAIKKYQDRSRSGFMDAVHQQVPALSFETSAPQKRIVRTGTTKDGRRVVEYEDGTREVM